MKHIYYLLFALPLLFFLLLSNLVAQNTCATPHNLPAFAGQNCPGGITPTFIGTNFDPSGPSTGQAAPGCFYQAGYDDIWHRAVVPPNAGGIEVYFSNIRDCQVGGFLSTCLTELECAVYGGANCNALNYYGCLEVGWGQAITGVHVAAGSGGILVGGYPGDVLYLRTFEADDQNMSYDVDYVAAVPPGSFCGFPLPVTVNGCNHGGFGANFTPPGGCWLSNENTVYYTFDVTATTPQPVQVTVYNIGCTGGGNQLQLAIYDNDCNTVGGTGASYHGHACGTGTVTLTATPNPLPIGTYFLVVDGDAGADCEWSFAGGIVLDADYRELRATYENFEVTVDWETGREENNMGFFVERSLDGEDWKEIGFVNGAFESTQPVQYEYVDKELLSNIQYYRLRQMDMDGTFTYSYAVEVYIDFQIPELVRINALYPNPSDGLSTLSLTVKEATPVSVELFDMTGRKVKSYLKQKHFQPGVFTVDMDVSGMNVGLYTCRVTASGESKVVRLAVAR